MPAKTDGLRCFRGNGLRGPRHLKRALPLLVDRALPLEALPLIVCQAVVVPHTRHSDQTTRHPCILFDRPTFALGENAISLEHIAFITLEQQQPHGACGSAAPTPAAAPS